MKTKAEMGDNGTARQALTKTAGELAARSIEGLPFRFQGAGPR